MYTVRLENTVTHQIYEQQVEDTNDGGKLYFRFGISTIDLADGEYILTVFGENGDVLAEDLLRIGDFNPQTLQYTKGEKTYLDITVDAILQREKNVSITDIHTRILPDLGNDAVEIVYVDAQPLYDSARSEGYDEGYGIGQSEGYPNGFADGYDSGRTDGYNEGYDVGSMDMHLEMLEETRILNVTKNGRYFTKYTEDPYTPTGDGDFSDFCKLTNATYQMGRLKSYYEVQETGDDVIEFWWRPKDLAFNNNPQILMSSIDEDEDGNGIHHTFSINLLTYDREDKLRFYSDAGGGTFVEYIISDPEMWYHILLENNGVYVNDEYVGKLATVNDNEISYVYVNGDTRTDVEDGVNECNGYFGMVKINGEVFIPTENGYMDQNKGNIIQPIEGGEYEYLKQRDPEGGLYRTVNVNIDTKQYFLEGYDEGYDKGYNVGEQASFGNGYEQGQKDIAENARVLEVTENGSYLSKFSDPITPTIVTGVYDDDTGFYSYTKLSSAVYNTKVAGTIDSRLEFWYKGDNMKSGDGYNLIIGSGDNDNSNCFQVRYYTSYNNHLRIELGNSRIDVRDWDDTVWHHLIISKAEGLWIDGEKKGDFSASNTINGEFFINGIGYDVSGSRNANGTFGMIKIDDVVIIPTADGFRNVNTGELLEIVQDGIYAYTENLPKYGEGELFKTINVDVVPKIKPQEAGVKFQNSTFTEIPKWVDLEGITDMDGLFSACKNLTELPILNVPYCLNLSGVFSDVPFTDLTNIQYWVYPKNANWSVAFQQNTKIERCSAIYMEGNDTYYQGSPFWVYSDLANFTDFGGFVGLKYSITQNYALAKIPNLSYESCINVLNGLYDFVGNGETPQRNQGTLKVHQNFINNVGDDITIGTNKGWTITT